jgi:exportin-1
VVCSLLITPAHLQQQTAQRVLTRFQEHQDAWQRVPAILEASQNINTKVRHVANSPSRG